MTYTGARHGAKCSWSVLLTLGVIAPIVSGAQVVDGRVLQMPEPCEVQDPGPEAPWRPITLVNPRIREGQRIRCMQGGSLKLALPGTGVETVFELIAARPFLVPGVVRAAPPVSSPPPGRYSDLRPFREHGLAVGDPELELLFPRERSARQDGAWPTRLAAEERESSVGAAAAAAVPAVAALDATRRLERCDESLGTLRIEENIDAPWFRFYFSNYKLGSTVPLLRAMIQQSNCFEIVDGAQGMVGAIRESIQGPGRDGRAGSSFGSSQRVGADYSISPEILVGAKGGAAVGGLLARVSPLVGGVAGSAKLNEAGAVLQLVDVRSAVRIAAAEGYSRSPDLGLGDPMSGLFGSGIGAGGGSAYANTPEGKLVASAFVDAYNKMVVALRDYKAQTVKGGLGTAPGRPEPRSEPQPDKPK